LSGLAGIRMVLTFSWLLGLDNVAATCQQTHEHDHYQWLHLSGIRLNLCLSVAGKNKENAAASVLDSGQTRTADWRVNQEIMMS